MVGTAVAVGSCSRAAASAAEARTAADCSSTNAATIGKLTTFELIVVIIIITDSTAVMKPFGVHLSITECSTALARLASIGSDLKDSMQALSASASECVDRKLPTAGSSEAESVASLSVAATAAAAAG